MTSQTFDYVIVGAGSAGCVLANRLSSDPNVQVALIEAGPSDRNLNIKLPAAFTKLFHTKYDWDLFTTSQPELKARELYWPRGKTLGGSSSLNAQMWVRGAQADYDDWAETAPGWSYEQVLPYFQRSEHRNGSNQGGVYGVDGPLWIEELRDPNPLRAAFLRACTESGMTRLSELNDPGIDGFAPTPVTQRRGRRWSAADGYLRPAAKRANLTVFVESLTQCLTFDGTTVTGLEYRDKSGRKGHLVARREVILSAGAINSPQLLQLSGIGDADVLRAAGIEPRVELPAVGRNLQDHLSVPVIMFSREAVTLVDAEKPVNLVKYLLQRRGMLTSNVGEGVAFVRSEPGMTVPDIEFVFAPVPFMNHGQDEPPGHGITLGVVLLQPESRGSVQIRSAEAGDAPVIEAGYLREAIDLQRLVSGVEQAQALFATKAFDAHVSRPMLPAADQSDLSEYVRMSAETLYHPAGTCRMGSDPESVVDPELRVRGVSHLRVVDASVMPKIIRGHTHAPTVMIAEKAAELIIG